MTPVTTESRTRTGCSAVPEAYPALRVGLLLLAAGVLAGPMLGLAVGLAVQPAPPWRLLLPDARQGRLLAESLLFSGAVALAAMLAGLLAALAVKRHPLLDRAFRLACPPLLAVPPYLFGVAWAACFFAWSDALALAGQAVPALAGWVESWAVECLAFLPLAAGFAFLGLENLPPPLLEAARLHHPEGRVFLRVGLPLALPALGVGTGLLFLLSLADYGIPSLFAVNVYAMEIFSRFSADGDAGAALLAAVPLVLLMAVLLAAGVAPLRQAAASPLRGGRLSHAAWPLWLRGAQYLALALLLAQAVVPAAMMCRLAAAPAYFLQAIHTARGEMGYSLALAGIVALAGVPLALALSSRLARPGASGLAWWTLVLLPLALPASLLGIGLVRLVNLGLDMGVNLAPLAPLLANLARFLPVAALILYAQRLRVDPGLLDAMRGYQRSHWQGAWRVQAPLLAPGMALAAALLFTLTLSELSATLLVAEPGSATLMMRLYNLLHYGASREVAALCLALMGSTLALGIAAAAAARCRRSPERTGA